MLPYEDTKRLSFWVTSWPPGALPIAAREAQHNLSTRAALGAKKCYGLFSGSMLSGFGLQNPNPKTETVLGCYWCCGFRV